MSESERRGGDAGGFVSPTEFESSAELEAYRQGYAWADPAALELYRRLAAADAARRSALVRRWNAIGLSKATGQHTVLRNLYFAEAYRMTQTEIGRSMNVTSSNVTRLIDGLEQDGLVRRVSDTADRRVTFVELTDEGCEVAARIAPAVVQFAVDMAGAFTEDELRTLLDLLARLQAHAEALDASPGT